jgi:hypothetical protein
MNSDERGEKVEKMYGARSKLSVSVAADERNVERGN